MSLPYIPGDLEEDIREAYRQHVPLDQITARTGISTEQLRTLLGIATSPKPIPADDADFDLWAADALDAVL